MGLGGKVCDDHGLRDKVQGVFFLLISMLWGITFRGRVSWVDWVAVNVQRWWVCVARAIQLGYSLSSTVDDAKCHRIWGTPGGSVDPPVYVRDRFV